MFQKMRNIIKLNTNAVKYGFLLLRRISFFQAHHAFRRAQNQNVIEFATVVLILEKHSILKNSITCTLKIKDLK